MTVKLAGSGPASLLGDIDLHLYNEGTHARLYRCLGSHVINHGGTDGVCFAVWAPEAEQVDVVGDWDVHPVGLKTRGSSGIWEGFVAGAKAGQSYHYAIRSRHGGQMLSKADPCAQFHQPAPGKRSVIWDGDHAWGDANWMANRSGHAHRNRPVSIYEAHLGSWRRKPEENNRQLTWRELAPLLADHVEKLGFTHVELMPVMEHPFQGSWGYQITGFFAPSSLHGPPEDFMYLVDVLHQRGIGVILDWVPGHFPTDAHGPYQFDGSHLYEHADPTKGIHPHWSSAIFNYGRHEVRSFLLSSACVWLDRYHIDGLRVDGVASMLYLDYGRESGGWEPNRYGGKEHLEAVDLLRQVNDHVHKEFPGVVTMAEESTAWPGVTRPTHLGGLGFDYKWDLGWMNDTLRYLARDPIHRTFHHNELTFRGMYQFQEHYVLPLSHDECVHGKGSLLRKMAGDEWQRRANLRLLLSWQCAQPGKKLVFMGTELAPWEEWNHDQSLPWHLMDSLDHSRFSLLLGTLNHLYRDRPALHARDHDAAGFQWLVANDADKSVLAFVRHGNLPHEVVIAAFNFTPLPRQNYRLGVPFDGHWLEILNTDAEPMGGSGQGNAGGVDATPLAAHGFPLSVNVTLPPLSALFLAPAAPPTVAEVVPVELAQRASPGGFGTPATP